MFYEPADAGLPSEHDWDTGKYLRHTPKLFEAVRDAVGPDIHLLHDVHHRLTPIEAARLGKDLEPYRLFWMEDATPAENQEAFRLIRQHTTTPLAVGEIFNTIWDCKDLIENQLIDYIRTTVVHAGGITHLRRIADLAALYQVRTGCHGATDLSPVCMGAALHFDLWVPNFGIQEYMRHTDETDAVFPHAYTLRRRLPAPRRGAGPRRRDRRGAGREVPVPARLPAGEPAAARRHAVALVKPVMLAAAAALWAAAAQAQGEDVPFVVTPDHVTREMLRLAEVGPNDFVIDLGSGDGRIVIAAAQLHGARGLGVEIVPALVEQSLRERAPRRRRRAGRVSRAGPVRDRPGARDGDHHVPAARGQSAIAPQAAGLEAGHTHRLARLGSGRLVARPHADGGGAGQAGRARQALAPVPVDGAGSGARAMVRPGAGRCSTSRSATSNCRSDFGGGMPSLAAAVHGNELRARRRCRCA